MIFFLVNNDYQLFDARHHAKELGNHGMTPALIEVPHALGEVDRKEGFASLVSFPSPVRSHRWFGAWRRYFPLCRKVERALTPCKDDVLFLYTEFELLNHSIAMLFKRANARVYLLEDGGVGTYLPFSLQSDEPLSPKQRLIAAMTRCLPRLGRTKFHKVNGVVFPWLEDKHIDGVCLYRPLRIVRSIPVHVVRGASAVAIEPKAGRAIFLNERMYDDYQTDDQYLEGLDRILASLTSGFEEVLFKFHPREEAAWIHRIRTLIASRQFPVRIIEDKRAIEAIVAAYRPEVIASYFSTALLNLEGTGIEPMFLYQLLPGLASQRLFMQLTTLLHGWRYRFVTSWDEVRSGYRCEMRKGGGAEPLALFDLVRTNCDDPSRATGRRSLQGPCRQRP